MTLDGRAIRNILAVLAALILAVLFYAALKTPTINLFRDLISEKALVFKDTNLVGWKDGRKQWEVLAGEIWTTRNQGTTTFENVKDGTVYKKGRAIVKHLKARRIIYNSWSKDIEAQGKLPDEKIRVLYALIDIENLSSDEARFRVPRFVSFQADHAIFNQGSGTAKADGGIIIKEGGLVLRAEKMEIEGNSRKAEMTGGIKILKADTKISGDVLIADFASDTYVVRDRVEMAENEKTAVADRAIINNKSGETVLHGHVNFLIEKASAEGLAEKTMIDCDTLRLDDGSKNAAAEGHVVITQKGRRAKSDYAFYNRLEELITLTGNVFIEKEKDWLKTQKVLVSVSQESFEAVGQVEAEFKIKK